MILKHLVFYCGPNRHSDTTLIELLLEFSPADLSAIAGAAPSVAGRIVRELESAGVMVNEDAFNGIDPDADPMQRFGRLCCATALRLQQSAGHEVSLDKVLVEANRMQATLLFEHEESQVGEKAGMLALSTVADQVPGLDWPDRPEGFTGRLADRYPGFRSFAERLVQPRDTKAIIAAAMRAGVPVVKLERDPYEPVRGDFRIRMNSMLMLGHSAHRQVIDGTFAIEKSARAAPVRSSRPGALAALARAQFPVPAHGDDLGSAAQVEGSAAGDTFRLVVANGALVGAIGADGTELDPGVVHVSTRRAAESLAGMLGVGLVVITLVTPDLSRQLQDAGGVATNLEIAPELDRYLKPGSDLHARAMDGFVRWLVPEGDRSRIPIVGVTGTNGKTTACRMIAAITQAAGFSTGLVCTDGRYMNGTLQEAGDQASFMGHYRVFESRDAELAVLETHHRGMAVYGFAFDRCDVAVCTNVSFDHIGEFGLDSVAEMAVLKRSLLERARRAAVLNADNEHCLAMLPHLSAGRICLVSMDLDVKAMAGIPGRADCFCVLEYREGAEWIVLYDDGQRIPVIGVEEVPATHSGLARFNVSNAMHAIAACHLLGLDAASMKSAMSTFATSYENTPGRLNEYHGHPFRVLMDFAHNADGILKLAEFTSRLQVAGRRLLMFQARGDRGDRFIRDMAAAVAGHYDHFVCRTHPVYTGPNEQHVLDLIKATLRESGVDENRISAFTDPGLAVDTMLGMGRAGDLLVFAPGSGQREDTWQRITSFRGNPGPRGTRHPGAGFDAQV